jgi:hypothetical protein
MGVPYEGSYKMFDTGSVENPITSSIKGAQKHNAGDSVDGNTNFSHNIADAQVPLFDPLYAGNIFSLSDVSGSLQWRGYPIEVECYTCSFEEIPNPDNRTLIVSCSALYPEVTFNVNGSGQTSVTNGAISIATTRDSVVSLSATNIDTTTPTEQFIGWSYSADGITGYLNTSTSYSHTVEDDITIYAIATLSKAVSLEFCFQLLSTGKTEICNECGSTVKVYFKRDEYDTKPLEDLIWYSNSALSSYSNSGFYRKKTTITRSSWFGTRTKTVIDSTIYEVNGSNGVATIDDSCNGFISCT